MIAQELTLSISEGKRLANEERQLKDQIHAHEQMRGLMRCAQRNAFEWLPHMLRLKKDFDEYLFNCLNVFGEAARRLEHIESFRRALEAQASELLRHAVAMTDPQDSSILNADSLGTAVRNTLDHLIQKAEREMLPSWLKDESSDTPEAGTRVKPPVTTENRASRGPKRDKEKGRQVLDIVTRLAGTANWKNKLDEICEALDQENVAIPKTWEKNHGVTCWTDAADSVPDLAKKAIAYYLSVAKAVQP